jgi:hypothetical protein
MLGLRRIFFKNLQKCEKIGIHIKLFKFVKMLNILNCKICKICKFVKYLNL